MTEYFKSMFSYVKEKKRSKRWDAFIGPQEVNFFFNGRPRQFSRV